MNVSKNSFKYFISVQHFVDPDLSPSSFQKLSAELPTGKEIIRARGMRVVTLLNTTPEQTKIKLCVCCLLVLLIC